MTEQKIKLIGQLIDDNKPVTLIVTNDLLKVNKTVNEYQSVFPDIFLTAEWGYFKTPISESKKRALANLLYTLQTPWNNLCKSIF